MSFLNAVTLIKWKFLIFALSYLFDPLPKLIAPNHT